MIEILTRAAAQAAALDGVGWVVFAASLGGLVRGFSGFGTAMIFLPIVGGILSPVWALTTLMVMDMIGPAFLVRRMLPQAEGRDLARLGICAGLMLPIGVSLLLAMDSDRFRYAVSLLTLAFLILLVSGFRLQTAPGRALICITGGISGFLGGAVGVPGPPVMFLYLAGPGKAAYVRANIFIYLLIIEILLLFTFAVRDVLELAPVLLGALAAIPYLVAMQIGSRLFDPARERTYRVIAYAIIAASATIGLPFVNAALTG